MEEESEGLSVNDPFVGAEDGVMPMILAMDATIWVSTGCVIDSAYAPEWPRRRSASIRVLFPAT